MTLQTFAKYYENEIICHFRARPEFFFPVVCEKKDKTVKRI